MSITPLADITPLAANRDKESILGMFNVLPSIIKAHKPDVSKSAQSTVVNGGYWKFTIVNDGSRGVITFNYDGCDPQNFAKDDFSKSFPLIAELIM